MAREKLTDQQKKLIVADYIECQNYSKVAKKHSVSVDTVRRLTLTNEKIVNKLKQKKEENTLTTIEYMQTQHETKKRILDKILNAIELKMEDIDKLNNVRDLATAYGIILDKELKILEIQRGNGNREDLAKVQELLGKIKSEAEDDTK